MDNLRYISLQYIKGDNYEKIQCFKYEEMIDLLKEIQNTQDYSRPTFDALEEAVEEEKCPIGESFLNDLVNYYNFKDIKEELINVKKGIFDTGYDSKNGDARTELIKSLNELIKGVGTITDTVNIGDGISKTASVPVEADLAYWVRVSTKIKNKWNTDVSKRYKTFKERASKYDLEFADIADTATNTTYEADIKEFATFLIEYHYHNTEELKEKIKEKIDMVLKASEGTKEHLLMLLNLLKTVLLYEDNLDAIMTLFNRYIKICVRNIGKYETLFSKNDISNIDDAFMIKSYATFLHKLETLKMNLESKDQTKLERALTNALERLFDLYGINDTKSIIESADNYIYDHLLSA